MDVRALAVNFPDLEDSRWIPARGATLGHLREARSALAAGQAVLRNLPVAGPFSPSANPASRGIAIAKPLGPFTDGAGHLIWTDIVKPALSGQVAVFFTGESQPFLTARLQVVPHNSRQLTIGKGSLWIAARGFDPDAPDGFCGLLVTRGTLTASKPIHLSHNKVILSPGTTINVHVTLDPPSNPPTPSGPGVDLGQATIKMPATLAFTAADDALTSLTTDNLALTIYGSHLSINSLSLPAKFRGERAAIEIFGAPSTASFSINAKSDFRKPGGKSQIQEAGWILPVTETTFDKLGEAAGVGAISVALETGVTAAWSVLSPALSCSAAELICGAGFLYFFLTSTSPVTETFTLWDSTPRASSLVLESQRAAQFLYYSAPGVEVILAPGAMNAFLDRPLRVDGSRMPLRRFSALVALVENLQGRNIALLATHVPDLQSPPPPVPIALENALLLVQPASEIAMLGSMDEAGRVTSGFLGIVFGADRLVPILPDPYAVADGFPVSSRITSNIPQLECDPKQGTYTGTRLPDTLSIATVTVWDKNAVTNFGFLILGANTDLVHECLLLDVSSNADQFGVAAFTQSSNQIALSNVQWSAIGSRVAVATLPEISWEPMVNDPSSPPPAPIPAPNDGNIALLSVPSTTLVPVEPIPMISKMTAAVNAGQPYVAEFTLPFGITATANTTNQKRKDPNSLALVRPQFTGGLRGGYQLAMNASRLFDKFNLHTFPGTASVELGTEANPGYGASVLSYQVGQIFNGDFQNGKLGAPLERYDLSGYGASVFSDWRNPAAHGSAIIQARFNVFVGRTAYEVVQAQAFCGPWAARFVRIITIERQNTAIIVRHDTGWQPASDGLFQWPGISPGLFQLGPLQGVVNIHNIRDGGLEFVAGTTTWKPVFFDADVLLNPKVPVLSNAAPQGGGKPPVIPAKAIPGYLMILSVLPDLTANQLWALLDHTGPVSLNAAARVQISKSKLTMNVSSADVSHVRAGGADAMVAALRGTPVLPPQGSWSLARRSTSGNSAPVALDPQTPVPLVQNNADKANWHFAEPADVLNLGSPANEYGFLQSTGTQKLYFAQPRVHDGDTHITPQVAPHLADVGALLGSVGAFPGLAAALQFAGAIPDFQVGDGTLRYHKEWAVPATPPVSLLSFDNTVSVVLDYKFDNRFADNPAIPVGDGIRTHVTVDISPMGWSLTMQKVSLKLVTPLGDVSDPLLTIVGTLKAGSGQSPTMTDLDVAYGSILAPVETVFANLSELARFLPGGVGAQLDVSFSNGQLTIRDSFALPQLPLGIGFIEDIALDLGATITLLPPKLSLSCGISSPEKPFHWLVSPLSGNGCVVVGYDNAAAAILVQAGLGVGLDIDVGIAQGGASIVLGFQVKVDGNNVNFMALLTGQASVDVLDGLASATITLTAGLGLTPHPLRPRLPPVDPSQVSGYKPFDTITFMATCAVGIHISVCWLVHVDFDGSWQFSKTVDVPSVGSILPI